MARYARTDNLMIMTLAVFIISEDSSTAAILTLQQTGAVYRPATVHTNHFTLTVSRMPLWKHTVSDASPNFTGDADPVINKQHAVYQA